MGVYIFLVIALVFAFGYLVIKPEENVTEKFRELFRIIFAMTILVFFLRWSGIAL